MLFVLQVVAAGDGAGEGVEAGDEPPRGAAAGAGARRQLPGELRHGGVQAAHRAAQVQERGAAGGRPAVPDRVQAGVVSHRVDGARSSTSWSRKSQS